MQVPIKTLGEIVDLLDTGFKCFIHLKTLEIVDFPNEELGGDMEDWQDAVDKVDNEPELYMEIEKMNSTEGYMIMEEFIETVNDRIFNNQLLQAIEGRKPFANFKIQIEGSERFKNAWFAFKREKMIEFVNDKLNAAADDDDLLT